MKFYLSVNKLIIISFLLLGYQLNSYAQAKYLDKDSAALSIAGGFTNYNDPVTIDIGGEYSFVNRIIDFGASYQFSQGLGIWNFGFQVNILPRQIITISPNAGFSEITAYYKIYDEKYSKTFDAFFLGAELSGNIYIGNYFKVVPSIIFERYTLDPSSQITEYLEHPFYAFDFSLGFVTYPDEHYAICLEPMVSGYGDMFGFHLFLIFN